MKRRVDERRAKKIEEQGALKNANLVTTSK
jgi:hypothetical protein